MIGIYELDSIHCGECAAMMSELPDECIDLTVTSPPYDNLRTYQGYTFDFESIARQLYRVTKRGGVVVWVVGDATIDGSETLTSFKQALYFRELGFNVHDTMIYWTGKPPLTHNRYEQEFEYMFVFSKGRPNTFKPVTIKTVYGGDKKRYNYGKSTEAKKEKGDAVRWRDEVQTVNKQKIKGNIWNYPSGMMGSTKDSYAFDHPAIFPEALARDHILSWSNPGDIVLDPMIGSGTTAKQAHLLGRHYLGFDISEEYCQLAKRRLANVEVQPFLIPPTEDKPTQLGLI